MQLTIQNGNKWQRFHTRKFVKWFVKKYLSDGVSKKLSIDVLISKDKKDTDGNQGLCQKVSRSEFELTILAQEEIPLEGFLTLLAHEMVHVKQYAKGELIDNGLATKFLNKSYRESYNYWESPWEIEAHGRERGLVTMYARDNKVRIRRFLEQRAYK
jgi:hypothetical protein